MLVLNSFISPFFAVFNHKLYLYSWCSFTYSYKYCFIKLYFKNHRQKQIIKLKYFNTEKYEQRGTDGQTGPNHEH